MKSSKLRKLYVLVSVLALSMLCQVGVFASNLGDSISTDTSFQMNDYLLSQNGQYRAYWQNDGNFVVYNSNWQPLWATNTANSGVRCRFENAGNLVIRDYQTVQKRIVSDVDPFGGTQNKTINIYSSSNADTVSKRVLTDIYIVNGNIMNTTYEWINVSNRPKVNTQSVRVIKNIYKDYFGNFVCDYEYVYVPKSEVMWFSHTEGGYTGSNTLIMQNDGNLVIYDENNNPVWATGTN